MGKPNENCDLPLRHLVEVTSLATPQEYVCEFRERQGLQFDIYYQDSNHFSTVI